MVTIDKIIEEVDRKIRVERIYLHKAHKNGIFDFQLSGNNFEPYKVDHERIIYPLIENIIGNSEKSIDIIQDVYLLKEPLIVSKLDKDYFNAGVLGRTLLLDKEGTFVFTEYYKNIKPQSYSFKLVLPNDEELKLKALNRLAYGGSRSVNVDKILEASIHFPEPLRNEMKSLNPDMRFNSKSKFSLEKDYRDLSWKEIQINIKNLIDRLDDTCVNIFNRVDYINYLTNNVAEIKSTVDNLDQEDRDQFKEFYKKNKDWFNLIVPAIDLTQNQYYKDRVNSKSIKEQAQKMQEIMQYIVINIIVDNAPKNNGKKNKL